MREARHFSELENTEETLKLAKEVGTDPKTGEDENEYYPLGEGGILKALWEIADRAGLGLKRGASQTSDPPGNHRDHGTF